MIKPTVSDANTQAKSQAEETAAAAEADAAERLAGSSEAAATTDTSGLEARVAALETVVSHLAGRLGTSPERLLKGA